MVLASKQLSVCDGTEFTTKYLVASWREIYQNTVKLLHDLDSAIFEQLTSESATKRFMNSNPGDLRETWQLADHLYLEKNLSTDGIIGVLNRLRLTKLTLGFFLEKMCILMWLSNCYLNRKV